MISALANLQWLRPQWLWALLALPLLLAWWRARRRRGDAWRLAVDPHLLPHLLVAGAGRRSPAGVIGAALAYILAVLALAGPSWNEIERPLWQGQRPLVVAIDLSSAMLAGDVPPSRIAQARAKLGALLRARRGGRIALVAYAGDAFTVAPLTDDSANVALYLDSLAPNVMPVDGQRADRAIEWSVELLERARFDSGDILLITDHADAAARSAAAQAARAGYRVSVLGVGTAAGAPYRRADAGLAQARLDAASLRALARSGRGRHATLTVDDRDLRALGVLDAGMDAAIAGGGGARVREDNGYWLLPPLVLIALFAFRRNAGAALVVLALCLPSVPVHAASLWRRDDQLAHRTMNEAADAYRRGDFERAARLYGGIPTADAHYNRGNALAKAGRYPQAIAAYDEALRRSPGMADALANRRAVEAAMKRKPPSGGGNRGGGGQGRSQADGQGGANGAPPNAGARPPDAAGRPPETGSPRPADTRAQQAADAAQRQRMARALQQRAAADGGRATRAPPETAAQRERRLANEAWLRRVPDDPGGLLRAKFRLEHERRRMQGAPVE